ncbi:unnamed protein product [Arabis nemorensis]|uniref:F-box domain-containing protein n=1 Tax=Arabis nemorensis TaxID=586526 RepID=A0A565B3F7_9BRAS|nr:unnamed protein product [Arabis nemorensis]VVA95309.1 unnamed protein product [Arabis nemorensis]
MSMNDMLPDSLLNLLAFCWRSDHPAIYSSNRALQSIDKHALFNLRKANNLVEHWFLIYDTDGSWSVFDPYKNVWHTLPQMPFPPLTVSDDVTVMCVEADLLFCVYNGGSNFINKFELVTNNWSPSAGMTVSRNLYGWAVAGNLALVAGGADSNTKPLAAADMYDFDTAFVDNKFYVFGGEGETGNFFTSAELYDIGSKKWSVVENFLPENLAMASKSITVANGNIYLATASTDPDGEVLMYDRTFGEWVFKGLFPYDLVRKTMDCKLSVYRPAREQSVDRLVFIGTRMDPPTGQMATEIYAAEPVEPLEWQLLGSKTGWFAPKTGLDGYYIRSILPWNQQRWR